MARAAAQDIEALPEIRKLMRQYADLPMDFADATLVQAAKRHGIDQIFTLNRRDFAVYRLGRNKAFTTIPEAIYNLPLSCS